MEKVIAFSEVVMTTVTQNVGLGTRIIQLVSQYSAVSVEFISYRLNREKSEIERYVKSMEDKGAVIRNGDMIQLAETKAR